MDKIASDKSSGCWMWQGARSGGRYGSFRHDGRSRKAHRVAYELFRGDVPAGLNVLHTCDVPQCVNPDHLWVGTQADNAADMVAKGRSHDRRGELHHQAKLTRADVLSIRGQKGKETAKVLAKHHGVSTSTIYMVWSGHTWNHLN